MASVGNSKNLWFDVIVFLACGVAFAGASRARAEVSGLDHLQHIAVTNCKPTIEEKPQQTPFGPLCSYSQRLCDVFDKGKSVFQGVQIDVDCAPKAGETICPSIDACAKSRLPEKLSDYVRAMNDPNNSTSRSDGAGYDGIR